MLEGHFWGLTRYRILPKFLGLDYAGNIIYFRAYRKQSLGGWSAVTLGAPGSSSAGLLSSDTSGVNVLEDGYPMHYKASRKLQAYIAEERRKWEATRRAADEAAAKQKAAEPQAGGEAPADPAKDAYDSDQQFRDMLAIRLSHPSFYARRLRVSPLATFLYKCFYYYLWAVFVSLVIQGYLMFRAWVNPPARAGLKNLEEHVLHLPRLLFAGCVHAYVWLVRSCQPVIDPVVQLLSEYFPQVDWRAASAENLASKAEQLASDSHPSTEIRKDQELRLKTNTEEQRRAWWTKVLLVLLAFFSVLCVL